MDEFDHINELESVLQDELFMRLVGDSPERLRDSFFSGSIYQYSDRLNVLHDMVRHLKGAYNDEGIRRWFSRKRTMLGGLDPVQYLKQGDAYALLELACSQMDAT